MPNPTTIRLSAVVTYADPNYPEKKYQKLKSLLDKGQREQVINELKILYPKDSYLAHSLANRLGIDIQKELGIIYHYQGFDSTSILQDNTQTNSTEIVTQYNSFHNTLEAIQNATQYKGNLADTLMAGISGVFGAIQKGAEEITKLAGGKYQIAKYMFKAEGISISATYGYGSNDRDMLKTAVSVGLELAGSYFIGLALEGIIVSLGLASIPAFIVVGAISALVAGILMNTQAGKLVVNETTQAIRETITSLESKLQSFFSLFKSNPNAYELVPNPNLESKDYQSLIELLLDTNSTAKDIDSLLHSFPHYLQDSKQLLDSSNTDSTPTQSNTESTDSKTLTPNNNNPTPNTFPFSLQIKDYNTFVSLSNKQIQITNIDSKQIYTQTTDSRGYVSFSIDSKQRGDFFCPTIIHKDYHSAQHNLSNNITQRTICPHSYANHTAIVYVKQNNTQSQDNTNLVESIQFLEYIEWGIHSPQHIKIDYIDNKQDDITYPFTHPFAPGTYIELEAKLHNNVESGIPLQWGYIALHNELELQSFTESKRAYPLQYINDESQYFHTQNIYNKIGFYLPLQEYAYIVVFASTSKINMYEDIYLIINTDFKVGEDSNNGVIESKREKQSDEQKAIYNQTSINNLQAWNKLQCICSVKEAVEFLQANKEQLNKLYQNNKTRYNQTDSDGNLIYNVWFDYYRIYPSLAGKIAYIYYRFDVGDGGFIKSVDKDYWNKCKNFVEKISNIYIKHHKKHFEKHFIDGYQYNTYSLVSNFIDNVGNQFGIPSQKNIIQANYDLMNVRIVCMPKIVINNKMSSAGYYDKFSNTINIKLFFFEDKKNNLSYVLNNIFHEFRHFYILYAMHNLSNQSLMIHFIYYNSSFFYDNNFPIIFGAFKKQCQKFDACMLNCMLDQKTSLYYIQPAERDARINAYQFSKATEGVIL